LQKQSVAVPIPDNLYCEISPYPDPSVISEISELSSYENTSSNKASISAQKTQKNFAHEVLMSSVEGSKLGIAADEFESAKSKYDNNGSPNLCKSWSGPWAQVSEKRQRKKSEDLHLIENTHNYFKDGTTQNQYSTRRAFPNQDETQQRVPTRKCWLKWLKFPNPRFPFVKYRLVNTKVITLCLSYGILTTDKAKNKGFIIHDDKLEGGRTKMYCSG